jgi:hypothetical protein
MVRAGRERSGHSQLLPRIMADTSSRTSFRQRRVSRLTPSCCRASWRAPPHRVGYDQGRRRLLPVTAASHGCTSPRCVPASPCARTPCVPLLTTPAAAGDVDSARDGACRAPACPGAWRAPTWVVNEVLLIGMVPAEGNASRHGPVGHGEVPTARVGYAHAPHPFRVGTIRRDGQRMRPISLGLHPFGGTYAVKRNYSACSHQETRSEQDGRQSVGRNGVRRHRPALAGGPGCRRGGLPAGDGRGAPGRASIRRPTPLAACRGRAKK